MSVEINLSDRFLDFIERSQAAQGAQGAKIESLEDRADRQDSNYTTIMGILTGLDSKIGKMFLRILTAVIGLLAASGTLYAIFGGSTPAP